MKFPCPICMSDDVETTLANVREMSEIRRRKIQGYYTVVGFTHEVETTVTHTGYCPKHGAVEIKTKAEYHDGP